MELSEEDAAERDRHNQALREAAERVDFKRRTQVLQRQLPRPSVIDIDTLLKNASEISDPVENLLANEMALLMANDALKYPAPEIEVNGSSRPLEIFDDDRLNQARLEIAREMPSSGDEDRQRAFERAWDDIHNSSTLPGLENYGDDETEKQNLLTQAFEVNPLSSLLSSTPRRKSIASPTNPAPDPPNLHPARCAKRQQPRKETCPALRRLSATRQNPAPQDRRGRRRPRRRTHQAAQFSHPAGRRGGRPAGAFGALGC